MLSKEEIVQTNDWYLSDYVGDMEGFFYTKKSILNEGYTFYMRRYRGDGFTTIKEEGKYEEQIFRGYIKTLEDLKNVEELLDLKQS